MVSLNEALTILDEPENAETWIRWFAVLARIKKLKDGKACIRKNEITDLFLATTDSLVLKKILEMAKPREFELNYEEMVELIKKIYDQKRLIIAERTKFIDIWQDLNESTNNTYID